jgi:hypothetical protein
MCQRGSKPLLDWFDTSQPGTASAATVVKRELGYFSGNALRCAIRRSASTAC